MVSLNMTSISRKKMILDFQTARLSELAAKTGIAQETWCRWFSGHQLISGKSLYKASSALGVSPSLLLDLIENRKLVNPSGKKD